MVQISKNVCCRQLHVLGEEGGRRDGRGRGNRRKAQKISGLGQKQKKKGRMEVIEERKRNGDAVGKWTKEGTWY